MSNEQTNRGRSWVDEQIRELALEFGLAITAMEWHDDPNRIAVQVGGRRERKSFDEETLEGLLDSEAVRDKVRDELRLWLASLADPQGRRGFRVRLMGRSSVRCNQPRRFEGLDNAVLVEDALSIGTDGALLHDGLLFTVDLPAPDIHEAIGLARMLAAGRADQISLASSCDVEDPVALFAMSLEPGDGPLEYAEIIRDVPELRRIRRLFDDASMLEISRLMRLARREDARGNIGPRVERALRYLRRSHLETNPIDRFEDLSNGLQALEPRLREIYGAPTVFQRQCAACQEPLTCDACKAPVTAPDKFSGVDHVVTAVLKRSVVDARRLRGKRNAIVHSLEDSDLILADLPELTELATETLVTALLELLKADEAFRSRLTRRALHILGPPEVVAVVALFNTSPAVMAQKGNYPEVRLQYVKAWRPDEPLRDTDRDNLLWLELYVSVENFDGDWEPVRAVGSVPRDPEDPGLVPSLSIHKAMPSTPPDG